MAKATIKSPTGALITIEGTDREVSEILTRFERTTTVGQVKASMSKERAEKKEKKSRSTISDIVVRLKEEGFFDKAKGLSEIASALEEKGYICPLTTLSGVMLGLVQKHLFRRKKLDSKWVYGK
jgi:hypothetical protein